MNLHVLELQFSFNGRKDALYPVLLENKNELILVDGGYKGFLPLIESAALTQGFSLEKLTGIIITHHDMDHMGGVAEIKAKYPAVKIYSSVIEAPYISGKSKSLRLLQAEKIYPSLPEGQKSGALYFQEMLKSVQPVEVDYTFLPNEKPPFINGIQVLHTPGHMPGHSSLYIKETKILIAADALVYENGELEIANPEYTLDLPEAIASVRKLQQLEIDTIICYHGGKVEKDIQYKLSRLIHKYT